MSVDRFNYYEVLHVSPFASPEVIKAAHRVMSKAMHPDAGGSNDLSVAVNEAADVLLDPVKKSRYDLELRLGKAKTFAQVTKVIEKVVEKVVEVNFAICGGCGTRNRLNSTTLEKNAKCGTCRGSLRSEVVEKIVEKIVERKVEINVAICLYCGARTYLSSTKVDSELKCVSCKKPMNLETEAPGRNDDPKTSSGMEPGVSHVHSSPGAPADANELKTSRLRKNLLAVSSLGAALVLGWSCGYWGHIDSTVIPNSELADLRTSVNGAHSEIVALRTSVEAANNERLALQWAADRGSPWTQNTLGWKYDNGQGVPIDHEKAVEWFRKAADRGFANAQFNLGVMYASGKGVPRDLEKAAEWYRKAAAQGFAGAQANLEKLR